MSSHKRARSGSHDHDQNRATKKGYHDRLSSLRDSAPADVRSLSAQASKETSRGHVYEAGTIAGNSRVQMGDAYHYHSGSSRMTGPSMVAGNMTVNNSYYGYEQSFERSSMTQDEREFVLKKALYYDGMENRKAQLDQVDPASFNWIWTQTSFPDWLENGDGLYWISGKPASGKSTLMNYLTREGSEMAKSHLAVRRTSPLLVHFFFDFRAGSRTANTPVGLLRSLLLQLIDVSSDIKGYVLDRCGYRTHDSWPELQSELLDLLCESVRCESRTICAFIDGMDEYDGSLLKLAGLLVSLQKRSGFMLCLASRPQPELKHKLGLESFEMQSHNSATVRAYTNTALQNLQIYFDTTDLQDAAARIERDAEGVILWAQFAVDEIVCAVLSGERLSSALTKLDEFPSELAQIYQRIFDRLNLVERVQAAVAFYIIEFWDSSWTRDTRSPLSPLSLMMLYSKILFKMGYPQYAEFSSDDDVDRFRLKMRGMLHGLLTFSEWEVRLMHKTLNAFLRSSQGYSQDYSLLKAQMIRIADPQTLGPLFLCQNTIVASNARHGVAIYNQYSETLIQTLFDHNLGDIWNDKRIAPEYLAASQTGPGRQCIRFRIVHLHFHRKIPDILRSRTSAERCKNIIENYPEIVQFLNYLHRGPLELALKQKSYNLGEGDKEGI